MDPPNVGVEDVRRSHNAMDPPKVGVGDVRRSHNAMTVVDVRRSHNAMDQPKVGVGDVRRSHNAMDQPKVGVVDVRRSHNAMDQPKVGVGDVRRSHRAMDPPKTRFVRSSHRPMDPPKRGVPQEIFRPANQKMQGGGSYVKDKLARSRRNKPEYSPVDVKGPAISLEVEGDDDVVVGLQKSIEELVVQLTKKGDPCCGVVCIWGMAGTGKTTLAAQIYRHAEIRSQFAGFAWVSLSDNTWTTDVRKEKEGEVLIKILIQLTNTTSGELAERTSGFSERDFLFAKFDVLEEEGKNFLVILDDIWSDQGVRIPHTLISRFPNIKIILTTRNKGVTSNLNASIFFHELRGLDKQQSWELFEKMANFTRQVRDSEYNQMKELGEKMLQHCGGLPLAITKLGQLLSRADTTFEWQDIMFGKSVKSEIREDETDKNGELKDVSRVLSSSYNDLPGYLRPCFLYLAHFPKDSEIRVNELCRIWSAESDLLPPSILRGSTNLEEQAYGLIEKLVQRCMVQVEKMDIHGRIKTLRVHNLMRQLCLVKAEEEGSVEIIDPRNKRKEVDVLFYDALADVVQANRPRRIAIYLNKDVTQELLPLIESVDKQDNLESLICFNRLPYPSYEQVVKPLLNRFRALRVLKFENLTQGYIGNLPEEIGELSELSFLSLKGSHVEEVPSSIGNLVHLETLDLRTKWTLKLPNMIWKLERLRHLYLGHRSYISGNELRFGKPRNLQTLVNIPLMCCDVNDLMELTEVRNLKFYVHAKWWQKINTVSYVSDLLRSLAMENLSRARVDLTPFISGCLWIEKLRLEGRMEKLPEDRYFPRLTKLTLSRTDLEDDPMVTLEKLPKLRFLLLNCNAFKGSAMVCSNGGFPRLESLSLVALEQLKQWRVENGALPSLSFLLIEYCYELESIPDGLRCVTNLKKLVIKRMPREFEMKVEESGNDFYKVQHVLHIEFSDDEQPYCQPFDSSEYKLSTFRSAYVSDCSDVPEFSPKEIARTSNKFGLKSWLASMLNKITWRQKEAEESK